MKNGNLIVFTSETILICDQKNGKIVYETPNPLISGFKYKVCQSSKYIYYLDLNLKE